jgi:RNA-directed DNA polymerase
VTRKVKTLCRRMDTNQPLDALLRQRNPALQGWCAYFRPGVSSAAFGYLSYYAWLRVGLWLRRNTAPRADFTTAPTPRHA